MTVQSFAQAADRFALSRSFWRLNFPLLRQQFGKVEALLWLVAQAADEESAEWQFPVRVATLAKMWGWTERKVYRLLREMQTAGFITNEHGPDHIIISVTTPDAWRIQPLTNSKGAAQ